MATDIGILINELRQNGTFDRIARNPRAQFGTPARTYLGASVLPEQLVPENAYSEEGIKYRTLLANAGTRYSPTQKKGSAMVGSMNVMLAESDVASEFTSREYDVLLTYLRRNMSMDAAFALTRWIDTTINLSLIELLELWRWQAIVSASVELRGDNKYSEDVAYSNPTNHRAACAGVWSNDATDPFVDIFTMADLLATKGMTVGRIITSRKVASIMGNNDKVKARAGRVKLDVGGSIVLSSGRASYAAINAALAEDGLPPMELYDLQYRTTIGTARFMPDTVMVLIANTGRDAELDLGDTLEILPNTLGYVGIGRAAGQSAPGRIIRAEPFSNKPPRIEAEGWQTALPVITEPEGICVINTIA